ncbi:mycofactocin-coupled SDR family oxidoreductase [Nocardia cyriacigeorgica]|uniref:Mycofactocin-coupled SDR family oxidoreductase n=1 Tax=Nocardia cyriacigeorgica TaxID=135487 RepID=A0A6P1DAJ9_9NOCA|nr:mycofactocin-coupled SDR family oxidoreductase [Nocardia cyriacigeorgica]NEW42635.1 mycofactocin-coupled SDR family oxidoreductase [Nocardia cyriacigeorgica]NEW47755.1 mycofactocin-coupled SDR family oxidoreductase [Nocardia cyriacigeorgica]NEW51460.1 mycofactocin-coupled SDR family oxidoreductase [Nocardia cyriacigeorgica]NEW59460.1 mycofactocin-coupled SDR family oxidoreductase [Nocardia cyriacigeorgica]
MKRMQDKVALVTGAASGMGRTHCRRLAEEGADVIALDLAGSADGLAVTAKEVEALGRRCVTGFADVCDQKSLDAAVAEGAQRLGRLDVIVANAGIYADLGPSWELTDAAWQRTLDINLTGVWHTVRAGASYLPTGASIVIVSSTNGLKGGAGSAHYSASKHAVVGLARTLANEMGPLGIRVNTVHPGSVRTPMILNESVFGKLRPDLANPTEEDAAEALAQRNLLPVPWVDPVDVSNAVVFLASDESRYVTGTQLVVDAGLTQKV